MFMRFAPLAVAAVVAMPATAQQSQSEALFELLHLPEIIDIMRQEGISYGETIGADLTPGPPSAEWNMVVQQIYDYDVMMGIVQEDFEASLDGVDLAPIIAFFDSEQGQNIVELEVTARRALLDQAVEEASEEAAAIAAADGDPRFEQVETFVEINNLVELNVASALNSNLAFYAGLLDGNAFDGVLSEDQILDDVWSQEAEVRASTSEWIHSFLFMAYQPLEDADLDAYIAFSQTEAGGHVNRAMFDSFDRLFTGISHALGRAAASEMSTQEL
ncbi:DUF2059 domain-containing protein [Thalassorhabdomicrobium marinisediminis]|uniref:DUF2059 domain-containing protein n=1 Tax=Thalassorhabdomicrobium marinisediminis TaxID=2170577 RepID=UPI002491123F|nr:DUF2059 domain-containing protein [Thalassorhabdomicrobium marinisediminis]